MNTEMKDILDKIESIRNAHLEMYAAAFLKEVGSEKASEYVLTQRYSDKKITWNFEKKYEQKN